MNPEYDPLVFGGVIAVYMVVSDKAEEGNKAGASLYACFALKKDAVRKK